MPPPPTKKPPNKLVVIGVAVVLAGFLLPQLVAGSAAPMPAAQPADAPNYVGFLLKMAIGIILFTGVCVLFVRGKKPVSPVAGTMEILATVTLARGQVHLVRAGDRRLLLGVDVHGVKAVAELPGPLPESGSLAPRVTGATDTHNTPPAGGSSGHSRSECPTVLVGPFRVTTEAA